MQYKGSKKRIQQIGKELGVDYIVEGTVYWDRNENSNRIRVRPQLIKVNDDIHIWTDKYNISSENIFEVQSRIALKVASSLNLTLLTSETQAIQRRPTTNVQAYEFYLLGKHLDDRSDKETLLSEEAIKMLGKAIGLDSTFAEAYALLARIYGFKYFNYKGDREELRQKAQFNAEQAKKHAGESYVGHLAMGFFHYQIFRDYEKALMEFELALNYEPNNGDILVAVGYVQRRLGQWDEALKNINRSTILDPLSVNKYYQLIYALEPMRRFSECLDVVNRAIELDSTKVQFYRTKAKATYEVFQNFDSVENVIEQAQTAIDDEQLISLRTSYYLWSNNFEAAIQLHDSVAKERGQTNSFWRTKLFYYVGDLERARSAADSSILDFEANLESNPDDYRQLSSYSLALAMAGRYKEAIDAGRRAVNIMPVSKDAYRGAEGLLSLAEVYVITGEYEKAFSLLDSLLRIPSNLTINRLEYEPVYDQIRTNPAFIELLDRYSNPTN
jgi:tetratricopeptide (TPR) repeat protein